MSIYVDADIIRKRAKQTRFSIVQTFQGMHTFSWCSREFIRQQDFKMFTDLPLCTIIPAGYQGRGVGLQLLPWSKKLNWGIYQTEFLRQGFSFLIVFCQIFSLWKSIACDISAMSLGNWLRVFYSALYCTMQAIDGANLPGGLYGSAYFSAIFSNCLLLNVYLYLNIMKNCQLKFYSICILKVENGLNALPIVNYLILWYEWKLAYLCFK